MVSRPPFFVPKALGKSAVGRGFVRTSEGKAAEIEALVAESVGALGYRIVRVMLVGGARLGLQIMIERDDEAAIDVEDCALVSRTVSAILDVEDPIVEAYRLEVSSPGIERPLTRAEDFRRFAGRPVKLELAELMDGRRRFAGEIKGLESDGERVAILTEAEEISIPVAAIAKARLVAALPAKK